MSFTKLAEAEQAYPEVNQKENHEDFITEAKWPSNFWTQFTALMVRNFKRSRETYLSKLEIIQSLVLAVYCGIVWFQLPRTEQTVNDRMGLVSSYLNIVLKVTSRQKVQAFLVLLFFYHKIQVCYVCGMELKRYFS